MFHKNPQFISQKVRDDVGTVEAMARIILYIDDGGAPTHMLERTEGYALDILAIIGPGVLNDRFFHQALLLEIGFGRARPYHPALIKKQAQHLFQSKSIPKRRNWFQIDSDRLAVLWPVLEDVLDMKARNQIGTWENGSKWTLPMPKRSMKHASRSYHVREQWLEVDRGVHFSVAKEDTSFLQIIYTSDIRYHAKYLKKYAGFINVCLKNYKCSSYRKGELRRYARYTDSGLFALVDSLGDQQIRPHRAALMMRSGYVQRSKHMLFGEILATFMLADLDEVVQVGELIDSTLLFSSETKIRVIPNRRKKQDYIVFELVPKMEDV